MLIGTAPVLIWAQAPRHVYLTWQGSPSHTLTVNAQTLAQADDIVVHYDTAPHDGEAGNYRHRARGSAHQIPGLADGRWIHWIELTDLEPDTPYYFVVGSLAHGFSREYAFRTLPDDDRPVRFVTGGDLGVGDDMRALLRHAAARSPRFALIGGDLAYVNGNLSLAHVWDEWLDDWERLMVTPDGFSIPMVLAPGNHEVQGGYKGGPERAPFYTGFFAQNGRPSYFRLPIGENFVIYSLDTGHIVPHESQVDWLAEQMQADQDIPYRFAAYHVPLYPSHRDYDGAYSVYGRTHWAPLFDRFRLSTAFENHDHTFKRSKRLRAGAVDDAGTLYLGDGAWGRGGREIDLTPRWYLDKAGATRHVWVVDVTKQGVVYRAFDVQGKVFDVYPTDTPGYEDAEAYFRTLPQLYALDEAVLDVSPLEPLAGPFDSALVRAILRNSETYPAHVSVRFEVEDPLGVTPPTATLDLAPGDSAEVTFEIRADSALQDDPFPFAMIRANFAFARSAGDTVRLEARQRVAAERAFTAPPLRTTVTVDGNLDDWDVLPHPFVRAAPHEDGHGRWQGSADASLRFDVAYDDTLLYLALRVVDDRVVLATGDSPWDAAEERPRQDGLLLWLDPHPGGEGDDDPYLMIAPTAEPDSAQVIVADEDHRALAAAARAAARRDSEGYTLEIAVPLAALEAEGVLQAVRLNLALSDVDALGEEPDLVFWRPQWESEQDYAGFGVVTLQPRVPAHEIRE